MPVFWYTIGMTADFHAWAEQIRRLLDALGQLMPEAAAVGVPAPEGAEWFELLRRKLAPQLNESPLLVVAVVGGTNIGKSAIFNHLAGEVASASSPLAAGTKHPVCLAPPGCDDPKLIERLFEPFTLRRWHSAQDPLSDSTENLLFWRVGDRMPPRLLALDAPDVDSDAKMNWDRARAIRQAADVLVAILTQQKYNDAAVKQFFREAAEADKPIIVAFNQCVIDSDRDYWPIWLDTFCRETGAKPELVYVIPHDRAAAEQLRLPFYEVGADGRKPAQNPSSLRDDLASLHFFAIKMRTFRGAMRRVLDAKHGAPAYLEHVRLGAANYAAAARALSASEMVRVDWPTLPAGTVVDEIRAWWHESRSRWAKPIHNFYRALGRAIASPVRAVRDIVAPRPVEPPEADFHRRERTAILSAVEKLFDELSRLAEVGNETLRPRLLALLGGRAREELLAEVRAAHENLPAVDDDFRTFLHSELDGWKKANPSAVKFLRSLDDASAIARPAITVSLAVTGWALVGHLAGHFMTEAAIAGSVVGGEALAVGAAEGARQAAGRMFSRLQDRYAQERARWLAEWLETKLLGDLLAELRRGAEVPDSPKFREVQELLSHFTTDSQSADSQS